MKNAELSLLRPCVDLKPVAVAVGLLVGAAAGLTLAADLPTGASIVGGAGSVASNGRTLTVTQTTDRMAANWQSFNIGAGNTVNFVQPSASAVALNRVLGTEVSVIQGALNANGQVFLVNPNGVLFTTTAQVNVGGIVASTLNLTTEDFMAGKHLFAGESVNAVVNQGQIAARVGGGQGGSVALIAARIRNEGSISAPGGKVLMGAGSEVLLDLGGPVALAVKLGALDALIEQGGGIKADGGLVYLTAHSLNALTRTVIQHSGITEAQTLVTGEKGQIFLLGGMAHDRIEVGGVLDASAPNGGHGGFIETSAAQVQMAPNVRVTTRAPQGTTGQWLIDPTDFTIAAGDGAQTTNGIGATTLQNALAATDVTVATAAEGSGAGDILVTAPVSWSANTLTLSAHRNIDVGAALNGGANGSLALFYGQGAVALNNSATYTIKAPVTLSAGQHFSTKLGSNGVLSPFTVITSLGAPGSTTGTDLQGMVANLTGKYALGADLDASATAGWNANAGFMPIGSNAGRFKGVFEGLGHTISGLTINRPSTQFVGLIGLADEAYIQHIGLLSPSVVGSQHVGALVGFSAAYAKNSYATDVSVSGTSSVGGLIGASTGSIDNSFATGSVNAQSYVGGLTGYTNNVVRNSYAAVSVYGSLDRVGGLLGHAGGSLWNSYATGVVTAAVGATNVGALAGYSDSSAFGTNSYWNSTQNPLLGGIGNWVTLSNARGLTATEMQSLTNFSGFDTSTPVWGMSNSGLNNGLPVLCSIYQCIQTLYVRPSNGSSVYGSAPVVSYTLVNASGSLRTLVNASLTGVAGFTGVPTASSNAGSYAIGYGNGLSLTGSGAGNYSLQPWAGGASWTVSKAPLTVSANSTSKIYGDANPALLASLTGFVNGQTLATSGVSGSASLSTSATTQTGVGSVAITVNRGTLNANNYSFSAFTSGTLSINPRPITVTADAMSKTYGNVDPNLSYQITAGSLVGSDALAGALTRNAGENVGSYTIDASALAHRNYQITAVNGTFTVAPSVMTTAMALAPAPAPAASQEPAAVEVAESPEVPVVKEVLPSRTSLISPTYSVRYIFERDTNTVAPTVR